MSFIENVLPFSGLLDPDVSMVRRGSEVFGLFENFKKLVSAGLAAATLICQGNIPDPVVGENACQLRAGMFTEFLNSPDSSEILERSRRTFERVQSQCDQVKSPSKKEWLSFEEFLQKSEMDFSIDERVYQLVSAHLLTLTREPERGFKKDEDGKVGPWETIKQTDGLRAKIGLTGKAAKTVESIARVYLSHASVVWLQKKAREIPSERLGRLITENERRTRLGLYTVPCFSGAEILFAHARGQKTPLVVRIHQLDADTASETGTATFFFASDGRQYELATRESAVQSQAVIMTDAISSSSPVLTEEQLREHLRSRDITETILAFMATHPVYGGDLKLEKGPLEESAITEAYSVKAVEWGCAPSNPLVCRLYHMYPLDSRVFQEEP